MDYIDGFQKEYDITLRIVRFEITPECFENIIKNLPNTEFGFEDFKVLYHIKWNKENSFRNLKYPLYLKAFHLKQHGYIVQVVWTRDFPAHL